MPISECCNPGVVCCEAGIPIPQLAAMMRRHHVGDVVVVENSEPPRRLPLGIVTDRDIVIETLAVDLDVSVFTAGDIMSTPLVTVLDDAGFVDALRLMRDHKIRRLPVVDASGILVGIVTVNDIITLLSTELQLATVAIAEQPLREGRLRR